MIKLIRKVFCLSPFNESRAQYVARKEHDQRYITGERKGVKW